MKDILKSGYNIGPLAVAYIFWGISVGLAAFHFRNVSTTVTLHWNVYQGVNVQGNAVSVWLLILIACIVLALNTFFVLYLHTREKFLSTLFAFSSAVFGALFLMAIGAIVYFN